MHHSCCCIIYLDTLPCQGKVIDSLYFTRFRVEENCFVLRGSTSNQNKPFSLVYYILFKTNYSSKVTTNVSNNHNVCMYVCCQPVISPKNLSPSPYNWWLKTVLVGWTHITTGYDEKGRGKKRREKRWEEQFLVSSLPLTLLFTFFFFLLRSAQLVVKLSFLVQQNIERLGNIEKKGRK